MNKTLSRQEEEETLSSVHDDLLEGLEEALQWAKGEKKLVVTTRTQGNDLHSATLTFQIYRDLSGAFRWRLKSSTGEVIAESKAAYVSKDSCEQSLERLKSEVSTASIEFHEVY